MSSTENEKTESESPQKFADTHPIGAVLDEWAEWVSSQDKGSLSIRYDQGEDVFSVVRKDRKAVIYTADIDEEFYGEAQAVFVESEIGEPPDNLDLSQTLKFSGNELVLSRISLSDRHSSTYLIVEAAIPTSHVKSPSFDLTVLEVATIARDLRKHLGAVLKSTPADDDEEEYEEEEEDDDDNDDDSEE